MNTQHVQWRHLAHYCASQILAAKILFTVTRCERLCMSLSSRCCFSLPSTPWTHSLQPEAHIHPLWYSEDSTLWTQSPTKRAPDLNCTISIFHFFCHEKLLLSLSLPLAPFGSVVPFIESHSQLRPSVSPRPQSCVNSSVSLIWDFCHLLSFSPSQ